MQLICKKFKQLAIAIKMKMQTKILDAPPIRIVPYVLANITKNESKTFYLNNNKIYTIEK